MPDIVFISHIRILEIIFTGPECQGVISEIVGDSSGAGTPFEDSRSDQSLSAVIVSDVAANGHFPLSESLRLINKREKHSHPRYFPSKICHQNVIIGFVKASLS